MKKIKLIFTVALTSFISITAFAQSGTHGGDPNELAEFIGRNGEHLPSWFFVKNDLISGFENNQHLKLDLHGIDSDLFKKNVLEILRTTSVEFKNEKIIVDGVLRACKNYSDLLNKHHIQCDPQTYASDMSNYRAEEQYRLIAHEYFSSAGFEPNSYGLSDYPFSSQISKSLEFIIVKHWGVSNQSMIQKTVICTSHAKAEDNSIAIIIVKNSEGIVAQLAGNGRAKTLVVQERIVSPRESIFQGENFNLDAVYKANGTFAGSIDGALIFSEVECAESVKYTPDPNADSCKEQHYQASQAANIILSYDFDHSGTISASEALNAFPNFEEYLSKESGNKFILKAIFTYTLNYGKVPDLQTASGLSKFGWWCAITPKKSFEITPEKIVEAMSKMYPCYE